MTLYGFCDFQQVVDAELNKRGIALNGSVLEVAITKNARAHMEDGRE
jgi:hypothetical protein